MRYVHRTSIACGVAPTNKNNLANSGRPNGADGTNPTPQKLGFGDWTGDQGFPASHLAAKARCNQSPHMLPPVSGYRGELGSLHHPHLLTAHLQSLSQSPRPILTLSPWPSAACVGLAGPQTFHRFSSRCCRCYLAGRW